MTRVLLYFKGSVQGVGFRVYLKQLCDKYHLFGYVCNLDNGNVKAEIQGDKNDIDYVLKIILKGNLFIKVTDYQIKTINIKDDETNFNIIYS